jgi:DNA polymerase III epsilon subunit-like protein
MSSFTGPTKIIVFDTETNGLLPKKNAQTRLPEIGEYPYILQLSFVVYNMYTQSVEQIYNEYIKIEADVNISAKITEITGITREMCDSKGIPIQQALHDFYNAYVKCDRVVAHNLSFDQTMIETEIARNKYELFENIPDIIHLFDDVFNIVNKTDLYCTMNSTKKMCNLIISGKYGPFLKSPKLIELHEKLFGYAPVNLHDAKVDTIVCLKCYLMHEHNISVPDFVSDSLKTGAECHWQW